jgi:hypothetical protein
VAPCKRGYRQRRGINLRGEAPRSIPGMEPWTDHSNHYERTNRATLYVPVCAEGKTCLPAAYDDSDGVTTMPRRSTKVRNSKELLASTHQDGRGVRTPAPAVHFHAISHAPCRAYTPEAHARELPQAANDHCCGTWSTCRH